MLIGISGKIGSGKDTIGNIIQYLEVKKRFNLDYSFEDFIAYNETIWEIKKMADKLKDIVCLLIGCTRQQLESNDFKNSLLPDAWQIFDLYTWGRKTGAVFYNEEELKDKIVNPTSQHCYSYVKSQRTVRWMLQYIGTELFRDKLHENVHINALFTDYNIEHYLYGDTVYTLQDDGSYKPNDLNHSGMSEQDMINLKAHKVEACNWIITDVRFPNEVKAVKSRKGILIRVNRSSHIIKKDIYTFKDGESKIIAIPEHPSETGLDNYDGFDYVIDNNGTIEELVEKVRMILTIEKII